MAAAVVVSGGQLLLLRHGDADGQPAWSLPLCALRDGESAEDAVVRETRRMTGLTVQVRKPLCEAADPLSGQTTVYLACSPVDGTALSGDHAWCGQPELLVYLTAPLADEVQRYVDGFVG